MIPVVVINLPRSADCRDDIAAHLGHLGIPYRLFAAVDGKTLSDAQRARYGSSLPLGAMGCAESHLALLREIADGPDEFVCILEDDVFCGPSMVFTNVINPRSHVARKNEYRTTLVRRIRSQHAPAATPQTATMMMTWTTQ